MNYISVLALIYLRIAVDELPTVNVILKNVIENPGEPLEPGKKLKALTYLLIIFKPKRMKHIVILPKMKNQLPQKRSRNN